MSLLSSSFRESFRNMSVPAKIILLVLIVLVTGLFGSLLSLLVSLPVYNISFYEIGQIVTNPDLKNINIVKFFQISQTITLFLLPALICAWLYSDNTFSYLQINNNASLITLCLICFSIISAIPALNLISQFNMNMDLPVWLDSLEEKIKVREENAQKLTELFLAGNNIKDLVVNFVMIAILPAFAEEMLFRGTLQRLLTDWIKNHHISIFIAAFVFSFIHFQFYGFIPRFLLGLYFGYLLFWSGSLWAPILAHLINNGVAVIVYHFSSEQIGETTIDKIGTVENGYYMLYLSVVITAIIISTIYLREKVKKESLRNNFR